MSEGRSGMELVLAEWVVWDTLARKGNDFMVHIYKLSDMHGVIM